MSFHVPPHDLWWLAAGSAGQGARYLTARVSSYSARKHRSDPTEDLLQAQSQFGYNAHSLVSIGPDVRAFWPADARGAIVYREFGNVWLAAGDPLTAAPDSAECVRQFFELAHRCGRVAAMIPATARLASVVSELSMTTVRVGASPYFKLSDWDPRGDRAKGLRAGINRARREGVLVQPVERMDAALEFELKELCRKWGSSHRLRTELSWLIAVDPLRHGEHKRFFAARGAGGRLVGFLAASSIPARDGWYLEDVLRLPDAPACTADLLVYTALTQFRAEGASLATLGTVPFHLLSDGQDEVPGSPRLEAAVERFGAHISRMYNIEGLRHFKSKFVPTRWESEYLLCTKGFSVTPRVVRAVMRALLPGGLAGLVTREFSGAVSRRLRGVTSDG